MDDSKLSREMLFGFARKRLMPNQSQDPKVCVSNFNQSLILRNSHPLPVMNNCQTQHD